MIYFIVFNHYYQGGLFGRELPMCCLDHPVNVRPGVETGEDLIAACRDNWCPDCD